MRFASISGGRLGLGSRLLAATVLLCILATVAAPSADAAGGGEFTLTVLDPDTGEPMPCRMHITNEKGKPQRVSKMPFWHDHFVFPGTVKIKLPKGTYQFVIERGPEYLERNGYFIIEN